MAKRIDAVVNGGGTLYVLVPITQEAEDWVEQHVSKERQSWGKGFAVEHRYIGDIVRGMQDAGLRVV